MIVKTEIMQRITAGTGYGSGVLFAGMSAAEVHLMLQIVVGALAAVSLLINIFITIRKERRRKKP